MKYKLDFPDKVFIVTSTAIFLISLPQISLYPGNIIALIPISIIGGLICMVAFKSTYREYT